MLTAAQTDLEGLTPDDDHDRTWGAEVSSERVRAFVRPERVVCCCRCCLSRWKVEGKVSEVEAEYYT